MSDDPRPDGGHVNNYTRRVNNSSARADSLHDATLVQARLDKRYAVERSEKLAMGAVHNGEDTLVQQSPTVHAETLIPRFVAENDLRSVVIADTWAERRRMAERFRDVNIAPRVVNTPYEMCDMLNGTHGDAVAEMVEAKMEEDDVTLGSLHVGHTMCGPDCPFRKWKRDDFTEDVVIAHSRHAHIDGLLDDDRVVFSTSPPGDAFVTVIDDPGRALDSYIGASDVLDFADYKDFIENRGSGRGPSVMDYLDGLLEPSEPDRQFGLQYDEEGHHLAPLIVHGLQHSVMLDNDWETTYHYRTDENGRSIPTNRPIGAGPDPFDAGGVDYFRQQVVRDTENDTIYVLDVPDFSQAKCVVGFDVAPTPWLWNLYYGINFDYQRVLDNEQTVEFLQQRGNFFQTADTRKPYDSQYVTPGRDASIDTWVASEYGKRPIVVSTKNAFEEYYEEYPELPSVNDERAIQFRGGGGVITDSAPVITVNGSPRPQTTTLQMWGALVGESVPDEMDDDQSLGEVGDEIRFQFSDSRVAKQATRFESPDATVLLNTTAGPTWLAAVATPASPTDVLGDNESGLRAVARFLRYLGEDGETATLKQIREGADVSPNTAQKARDRFIEEGWVVEHPKPGRQPTEYSWRS